MWPKKWLTGCSKEHSSARHQDDQKPDCSSLANDDSNGSRKVDFTGCRKERKRSASKVKCCDL